MKNNKDFDKKDAIFKAMLELISKHGFHSSPMSEVAKQADVAAGTIYHYFKSKDELICALYVKLKQKNIENLFKNDDTAKPFKDRFRSFYLQMINEAIKNPKEFYFLEQFANSPYLSTIPKAELSVLDSPIYDFLRKAVFTQVLRDIPPKILVAFVTGSASSIIKLQLSGEFQMTSSDLELAFFTCWDGIKKA
ncbi:TetR family transcriptional regulator [Arcicella aurantiaca]|uniref:TetR family transcriptional regulator n=1 Tax=Arcicella aurantiaca TaxID=591202 RepID=A0A316E4W2_9BACT|nr:TetR/AcrR family transcriptional regulator [Arcicella aurantiaca]PWK25145.1 TetR family transcriptional regulator [Arcicella aurantiaca]